MAPLFILSESSAGLGLLQVKDKKLLNSDDVEARVSTLDKINQEIQYNMFKKWGSAAGAVRDIDGLSEGKVPTILLDMLEEAKDKMKKASIIVEDKALGTALQKLPQFNITAINAGPNTTAGDLMRSIRQHVADLIPDISSEDMRVMSLGLAHAMSRQKVKFSPEKVDVMIVHAVSLLDDIDKDLNILMMRVKEWYGWHFPELAKILNDNLAYAKIVVAAGKRDTMPEADLSEVLPEELEQTVKAAAEVSMGSEIADEDLDDIKLVAGDVLMLAKFRTQLSSYLDTRMKALAPNLTAVIGPLIGARLIAHTGSLMSLAKSPGSTIQILGAEKALFRALKTKHATPKYGLLYHSSLVGQATGPNKGKMARKLAAKTALCCRMDALATLDEEDEDTEEYDDMRATLGLASRTKLELSLSHMENKPIAKIAGANGTNGSGPGKWGVVETRKYNVDADGQAGEAAEPAAIEGKKSDKKAKKSKKDKDTEEAAEAAPSGAAATKLTEEEYEQYAEAAGISVSKFKRKFDRGDVEIGEDGKPIVHSKKELKKMRKAEKKTEEADAAPSKRKRDDDGETPKKKKKKHSDA